MFSNPGRKSYSYHNIHRFG